VPDYMETYGRQIIRRYRVNASRESLRCGDDVRIDEFVRYVVDTGRFQTDVHWTPQHRLCQPCALSYDFVGHYETLWTDADYVLGKLGVDARVRFPRWTKDNRTTTTHGFDSAFVGVTAEYMKRLKKFYSQDYAFFGYT